LEFLGPYCGVWVCVRVQVEVYLMEGDYWFAIFVEEAKDGALFIVVLWF
jgi:hypothetical protein